MAKRSKKATDVAVDEGPPWDPKDIGDVSVPFLIEAAKREGKFVYDLETTGLDPRRDRIEGVAFYVPNENDPSKPGLRAWFPFVEGTMDHAVGASIQRLRTAMPQVATMEKLRELWSMEDLIAIAHNGVFDMAMLKCASGCQQPIIVKNRIADSMLADYMQDERARRYGLKIRVEQIFKHKMTTYDEASGKQGVFGFARKKPLGAYAMDDCQWTFRLWRWAMDSMQRQDPIREVVTKDGGKRTVGGDLEKIYWKIETEVQRVILEMETQGCLIDWEWLVEVQRSLEQQKADILEKIKLDAGWAPNLRSPKQVSDFLYGKKEDGGLELPTDGLDYNEDQDTFTTGEKVIAHFGKKEPIVKLLLDYRSLEVIDRSFCTKLIKIAQDQGRCYSHFRQTGTVIGRLSSADPINLMNQPRDKNLIRKSFCSRLPNEHDPERQDMIFLDADYGQVELRMAAHLANEKNMLEVYCSGTVCRSGPDGTPCEYFAYTHGCKDKKKVKCKWAGPIRPEAQKVCPKCGSEAAWLNRCRHVDLHQRTSEDVGVDRNPLAKNLNFGLLYRMGAPKFVTYADLYDEDGNPRIEYAQELVEKWRQAYPGIGVWHDKVIYELVKNNYIAYTLTRRRRRLDEEFRRNEFRAGTQAIQFMVSGSCQDIMKLAMVKIYQARNAKIANTPPAERKQWDRFRFLIQVHDEIVMEGPKCLEPEMVAMVKTNMENVAPSLRVPLVADCRTGRNWDETH